VVCWKDGGHEELKSFDADPNSDVWVRKANMALNKPELKQQRSGAS
jgi:hypothetical protein